MDSLKTYVIKNFEAVFVLLALVTVGFVIYIVPSYRLAVLNFLYIPVLMSGYYLGARTSVLGAAFITVMVSIYAVLEPEAFSPEAASESFRRLDALASIIAWGCFLILTGAAVGKLNERLKAEVVHATSLNDELLEQKDELESTARELREHREELEHNVAERTESLRKSKESVERLKGQVEDALYSTMDASVVRLMIEKRLRTEKRDISVLLCDLKSFTRYTELTKPEVVVTDLNRFLETMEQALIDYNAHIDKYMGDAILAEFGAPVDHQRHALMAVVAGLKMQEAFQRGTFPWDMRVAITTGEAIVGLISSKRQSYTALGNVVNLASRVEKLCNPGRVTIDEPTYQAIREFVRATRKADPQAERIDLVEKRRIVDKLNTELERDPDNVELLKQLGRACVEADDPFQAHAHIKRAMALAPDETELKIAFAEVSIKLEEWGNIAIRGREQRIFLYEVEGIRDPRLNRERIPAALHERYVAEVDKTAPYPEDLVLPVECLDGSVGHSRCVGFLAYAMADELGLPDMDKRNILEAGYLCDIGKTIVPHHLLNRAMKLSSSEAKEFEKHPREGVRKLRTLGYENAGILEIVESHQENFNGTGYPTGAKGSAIPQGARIIAVADAYTAMTMRGKWEARAAFSPLEKEASDQGKHDPEAVDALGRLLKFSAAGA